VDVYPTAHLVAEIQSVEPASPINVCDEFVVTYRVYNTGEADAWEVSATLSVNPDGSVRVAAGDGGYTQFLGTIAGWHGAPWDQWYDYVESSFTLHCKQVCESTLTITPAGNDECGWHLVWNQDQRDEHADYWWQNIPGREIDAEFIEPDSVTVKQLEYAPPEPDTSLTTFDISLDSGWNLISLPLIPSDTDIETVLSGVWANFVKANAYDPVTGPSSYIKNGPPPSLTEMTTGLGYWVYMNAPDTLTIEGQFQPEPPALPKSYPVKAGWNLIGFHSTGQMTAGDYLSALVSPSGVPTWSKMWGFDGSWTAVASSGMMVPGYGYWLAVTADGTIYP
jgi:hypothetical protein